MTPLTTVILEGHNEAMRYLVENGADINPVIGMVWSDLVLVWSRPPRLGLV
jgi:ankyrin repeat protein